MGLGYRYHRSYSIKNIFLSLKLCFTISGHILLTRPRSAGCFQAGKFHLRYFTRILFALRISSNQISLYYITKKAHDLYKDYWQLDVSCLQFNHWNSQPIMWSTDNWLDTILTTCVWVMRSISFMLRNRILWIQCLERLDNHFPLIGVRPMSWTSKALLKLVSVLEISKRWSTAGEICRFD